MCSRLCDSIVATRRSIFQSMSWNFCCGELHMTLDDMSRRQVRWVVAAGDAQVLGRDRDASRSPSSLNQHSTYSNNLDKKSRNANDDFLDDPATGVCGPSRGAACCDALLGLVRIRQLTKTRRLRRLQSYHNFLTLKPAKTRHPHALSRGETPICEPNIQASSYDIINPSADFQKWLITSERAWI